MAGVILTNPKSTPTTVTDDWQTLLARDAAGAIGMNSISLTNWDATTTKPAIAAGSKIEIGGSIAQFTSEEAIGGAPADGTVYLRFIVSGSSVTAELTATAPTWNPGNNGWYSGIQRYSGHAMTKAGTVYSRKKHLSNSSDGKIVTVPVTASSENAQLLTKTWSGTMSSGSFYVNHGVDIAKIFTVSMSLLFGTNNWHSFYPSINDYYLGFNSTQVYYITPTPQQNYQIRLTMWYRSE